MIAEIIPLARLPKRLSYFDYEVPQNFEGQIKIGQLVKISFRGRKVNGLVSRIKSKPDETKAILKSIIAILDPKPEIDAAHLRLLWWMSYYYCVSPALLLKTFIPEPPARKIKVRSHSEIRPPSLSIRRSVIPQIQENLKKFLSSHGAIFLFHYQNPKNKIIFYLKSVSQILAQGKGVLILEPQITDINTLLPFFFKFFSDKVAVLYGDLSKTQYWQEWQKIKNGQAGIVMGTRSAIFAPIKNLGLIVIDDEEMVDHKQTDQNPRYDSRQAALKLAELTGAKIILSSEAPRVKTFYQAKNHPYEILKDQTQLPGGRPELVDMNQEFRGGNFTALSGLLQDNIQKTLLQKQKVVLLLNRRGAATLMVCRDCGYVFKCRNCEIPLTCHETECNLPNKFVCHRCGKEEVVRLTCPKCHSVSIKYLGVGTQTVEREIRKTFLRAKVLRVDKDVKILKTKDHLSDADIFVGTQFFIKNFLPQMQNIGLIGVVSADTLFFRPDFRSSEKTFEWLTKIINFGKQFKSLVLIQTFSPNNFVVQSAIKQSYESFYQCEIQERENLKYPPFGKLAKLIYQHKNEKKCAFETAELFKKTIKALRNQVEILKDEKPQKIKQKFISTLILKFSPEDAEKILKYFKTIPDNWTIDMDPENLI